MHMHSAVVLCCLTCLSLVLQARGMEKAKGSMVAKEKGKGKGLAKEDTTKEATTNCSTAQGPKGEHCS